MPAFTPEQSERIAQALTQLIVPGSIPRSIDPDERPAPEGSPPQSPRLRDIAASLGLDLAALRQWALSKAACDKYPDHVELYHHARIIESDRLLDMARDSAEVTKRANQAKLTRHDAERRLSRLWGSKQEVTVTNNTPVPDLGEVSRRVAYLLAQGKQALPPPSTPAPAPRAHQRQPIDVTPLPSATHPAGKAG